MFPLPQKKSIALSRIVTGLLSLLLPLITPAQVPLKPTAPQPLPRQDNYTQHYTRAHTYSEAALFGPATDELNAAIEEAKKQGQERQRIEASIALGELLRKTGDYEKGLTLLRSLDRAAAYPELQVRRLDRIAAIYDEGQSLKIARAQDSMFTYLDSALRLSAKLHLPAEEASLYNQIGYHEYASEPEKGLKDLQHAADLFLSLRDTHNYVGAMTNVLRSYMAQHDSTHAGALIRQLTALVKDRKWYTAQFELYRIAAGFVNSYRHDSVGTQRWEAMAAQSIISNLEATNSAQMNAFRTLYETRKLQDQVLVQQQALDRETQRTRDLILFAVVLGSLALLVIVMLLRERHLRRRLRATNADLERSTEKYRLLMVESNHRIKNNLQMVISMLHYDEQNESHESAEAFRRMEQKIRTIGALHRHLSADVHNELVELDAYFTAIADLYKDMAPGLPAIRCTVAPVRIRSERIVYFGLILNEMLANTIAHREGQAAEIRVAVSQQGNAYRFDYRDDSTHAASASKGTGSRLIRQLIERIGGSDFRFDPGNGQYQFTFDEQA